MTRRLPDAGAASRGGVGALVAWLVLFGSVQAGLALPAREVLASPVVGAGLDYGRVEGTVAPLTDAFVAQALGLPSPAPDGPPAVGVPALAGRTAVELVSGRGSAGPGASARRVVVSHPPDNDDFAAAYEVPSVPFTATTDASTASRQSAEPDSCARTGPTLWYRYTPGETAGLTAHVAARNRATALGVFVGRSLDDLDGLGCDSTLFGPAGIRFLAEADTSYFFQVAAPLGAGEISFALDPLGTTSRVPNLGDHAWPGASCEPADVPPYPLPHSPSYPTLSTDGRFVVYESRYSDAWPYRCAEDQDPVGSDEVRDVFVYDRVTGITELVSVSSEGEAGNERSGSASGNAVSADGRYVAFWSGATNLVPDDTNGEWDLFVRDRRAGETRRVSVSSDGEEGRSPPVETLQPVVVRHCEPFGGRDSTPVRDPCHILRAFDMTPDGRYVVFWSWMRGLVDEPEGWHGLDGRSVAAVYRHDLLTGETILVSLPEHADANMPSVSADGNVIVYRAWDGPDVQIVADGPQYTPGYNRHPKVWARDLRTGETVDGSPGHDGEDPDNGTYVPVVSDDGRFVAFSSQASNLVPGDVNGLADVFVYDLETGEMEIATVNSAGEQHAADLQSEERAYFNQVRVSISADGRYVTFESAASNLAPESGERPSGTGRGDCPPGSDAFVRDRVAGTTLRVSVGNSGEVANGCSMWPSISSDASTVVFLSQARNLDEHDHNGPYGYDLFFHDFWVPL